MAKSGNMSTRGWRALRNFADGSCGIYALLQAYLLLQGVHPQTAERVFTEHKVMGVSELIRLCCEATVQANEGSDPSFFVVATGAGGAATLPASGSNDLATPVEWTAEILNIGGGGDSSRGWYDQRAMLLFARILGVESYVQVVCKTSEGGGSWYQSVDYAGPARAQVLILWSGGCHNEVVVRSVSVIASDYLVHISIRNVLCEPFMYVEIISYFLTMFFSSCPNISEAIHEQYVHRSRLQRRRGTSPRDSQHAISHGYTHGGRRHQPRCRHRRSEHRHSHLQRKEDEEKQEARHGEKPLGSSVSQPQNTAFCILGFTWPTFSRIEYCCVLTVRVPFSQARKKAAAAMAVEEPVEGVAGDPVEESVEEPADEPVEGVVEEPVEDPVERAVEGAAEDPVEQPVEQPAGEPVEGVVEENAEEPAGDDLPDEPVEQAVEGAVEGASIVTRKRWRGQKYIMTTQRFPRE